VTSPHHIGLLPAMDHAARRDRLRETLPGAGCEALLVTRPVDVRYLTGFAGSSGSVLVGADAALDLLITDARYRERVAHIDVPRIELVQRPEAVVASLGALPLGVDAEHVTLAAAARLEQAHAARSVVATTGLVAALRAAKDPGEIVRLRHACRITADVLEALASAGIVPGTAERDLARDIEAGFLVRGADGVAFATIVASGVNGASPHHEPTGRPVATGELVTIDCGAEVDGYHADMTRTLAVGDAGLVPRHLAEIHAVVEAANSAGRAAAAEGVAVAEVDRAARSVVEGAGYGDAFVHPTGHGIGLDIHEAPLVTQHSAASLKIGTAFTVEPGIYLPGIGGVRIEDSLVIVPDGVDVMTVMERRLVGT